MTKQHHPSDSTEQQLAHKEILYLLNEKYQLKLESRKVLINDTLFQVDGYSENPPILCEIFSLIGKMKVAQINKIDKDILKMLLIEKMPQRISTPRPKKIISIVAFVYFYTYMCINCLYFSHIRVFYFDNLHIYV